jgi:hypothetical protein
MDALRELLHPDVIARMPEGWPEPGPFVGREAVMRQFEQLRERRNADAIELTSDFIAAGDRVAVRQIWHGHEEALLEVSRAPSGRVRHPRDDDVPHSPDSISS